MFPAPSQDVRIHYFNWHHFKTACCTSPVATGKNCAQGLNCILSAMSVARSEVGSVASLICLFRGTRELSTWTSAISGDGGAGDPVNPLIVPLEH